MDAYTEKLIGELFQGKACCKCGRKAERLLRGKFYCPEHFVLRSGNNADEDRRVFRHPRFERKLRS